MPSPLQAEGVPPSVTLILGGARSGKSRYAQRLAEPFARVVFVATATAADEEMTAKIARHREERPGSWTTVEEPLALAAAIRQHGPGVQMLILDCLTFFAANLLDHDAGTEVEALLLMLAAPPCAIVLVSNEVGGGVVPEYASGRRFRDLLGEINQRVAAVATDVVLMVAGLPLVLKGGLRI